MVPYFWDFFLSMNDVPEAVSDRFFEVLELSKEDFLTKNGMVYAIAELLYWNDNEYVIAKVRGQRRLQIFTNNFSINQTHPIL